MALRNTHTLQIHTLFFFFFLLFPLDLPGSWLSCGSCMAGLTALKQTVAERSPENTQLMRAHSRVRRARAGGSRDLPNKKIVSYKSKLMK